MQTLVIHKRSRSDRSPTTFAVLIDDDMWERVMDAGPWYVTQGYARNRYNVLMHRLIMDAPNNVYVDHINGKRLDNRVKNLRIASPRENSLNKAGAERSRNPNTHRRRKVSSRFKGVVKLRKKFKAQITVNNETIYLGLHPTEEGAALAYDMAAEAEFGNFARLNFDEEERKAVTLRIRKQRGL